MWDEWYASESQNSASALMLRDDALDKERAHKNKTCTFGLLTFKICFKSSIIFKSNK